MTTVQEIITDEYDAVGGPPNSRLEEDGFQAGPTDVGEYVIAYCGRHSSDRYPNWSRIPWGARLKEERNGKLYVFYEGRWTLLNAITPVTRQQIVEYHYSLYGKSTVPSTWVFNDFGHMTCYYFKNVNKNHKRDKNEKIHGEFIHTTPLDEARSEQKRHLILTESHGCVHVKPVDIDDMIKKEYLKRGNLLVVHQYREKLPTHLYRGKGRAPFEVHFYPGKKKIIIKGLKR